MRKLLLTGALLVTAFGFMVGGYTLAQDSGTPVTDEGLCATPQASPGASPQASPESSPVAVDMGTPVDAQIQAGGIPPSPTVLYECPTPEGSPDTD